MSRSHGLLALVFLAPSACMSAGNRAAPSDGGRGDASMGVDSSETTAAAAWSSGSAGTSTDGSGSAGATRDGSGGESPADASSADGAAGSPRPGAPDPSTLAKKHLMGYLGWHFAPGDGSPYNGWKHWFTGNTPSAAEVSFDLWPDLTELAPAELFATQIPVDRLHLGRRAGRRRRMRAATSAGRARRRSGRNCGKTDGGSSYPLT
jgi:hypothetical protein